MARYSAGTGMGGTPQAMASTYKTLIAVTSPATPRRAWIYDINVGPDGAPADNAIQYKLDRQTTVGTGATITPNPIEVVDAAALVVVTVNHTAEPTVTDNSELLEIGANQRAAFRWVASPDGELIVPATANNGIGLRAKGLASGYTGTMVASMHFWE